jgi:hypothetical protein
VTEAGPIPAQARGQRTVRGIREQFDRAHL